MSYLKKLISEYPIRRKEEDKAKFRDYIIEECKKSHVNAYVETLDSKHNNVLIGDVDNAKVVITAHYDTPAASLFPNIMMPRNKVMGMIYQFSYPILLALISLGISYLLCYLFGLQYEIWAAMYIVMYLGSFYLLTRCFDNKNNYNDNTSGVATILDIISKYQNNDVAFILFDNEEKGKLGSKAFAKYHKTPFDNKLVINLDCVANGSNILLVAKDKAINNIYYKDINKYIKSNDKFNVEYYGMKGSLSNSDYKNFNCGVSVMACHKAKLVGYYTPRIHTKYDVVASDENIKFLSSSLIEFIKSLS